MYRVYQNPDQYRKDFNQYAQFSRSFVGNNSFAGNQDFARTANEAFVMDFGNALDVGSEHGNVVKVFNNLLRDDGNPNTNEGRIYNNYLDTNDLPTNNDPNYASRYLIDNTFGSGWKGRIVNNYQIFIDIIL
jgi:hypothetical protein